MNTLNFLDANVWLALLWGRHIHADKAKNWFERSNEEKFYFCRITQITVLRLLTTPVIMGNDVSSMSEAWKLWGQVCADDRIALLSEPETIEPEFRRLSTLRSSSPKVWADAYLLAFASVAGLKLITFDRSLRARGIDVHIL
jgi:toxin-antitoxin system PIN domain toxin